MPTYTELPPERRDLASFLRRRGEVSAREDMPARAKALDLTTSTFFASVHSAVRIREARLKNTQTTGPDTRTSCVGTVVSGVDNGT